MQPFEIILIVIGAVVLLGLVGFLAVRGRGKDAPLPPELKSPYPGDSGAVATAERPADESAVAAEASARGVKGERVELVAVARGAFVPLEEVSDAVLVVGVVVWAFM